MRNLITFRNVNSNPLFTFGDVEQDMRRIFDALVTSTSGSPRASGEFFVPSCDIVERDSHYLISLDVPGIPKEDIDIQVKDGKILISGERRQESKAGDYIEKRYGRFERALPLPQGVNEDSIEAHFENGVLSVALPKEERAQPKTINIATGKKEGLWHKLLNHNKSSENTEALESKG